jgi:hypothetical protein
MLACSGENSRMAFCNPPPHHNQRREGVSELQVSEKETLPWQVDAWVIVSGSILEVASIIGIFSDHPLWKLVGLLCSQLVASGVACAAVGLYLKRKKTTP